MGVTRSTDHLDARQHAHSEHTESFFGRVLDHLAASVAVLDTEGRIIWVNQAWRDFMAENAGEEQRCGVGVNYLSVCEQAQGRGAATALAVAQAIRRLIRGEQVNQVMTYSCHAPGGKPQRWFQLRLSRMTCRRGVCIVVAHENVTERRQVELAHWRAARHDPLTGLANRQVVIETIRKRLENLRRRGGDERFAVMFMDFDRFKIINDSLGHETGDRLLVNIARRLRRQVGRDALLARLGGDEFVVLLPRVRDEGKVEALARRLCRVMNAPHELAGQEVHSSVSIGLVYADARYERPGEVLRDADLAMYEAKAAGRSRWVAFDSRMQQQLDRRMKLERDLRTTLRSGGLGLAYQPIVRLDDGGLCAFEALVRWDHPELGSVSPGEFIPIAEETGLISQLGAWVRQQAVEQFARWSRLPEFAGLHVHVNLSRFELLDAQLAPSIQRLLEATGFDPASLHLEITENAVAREPGEMVAPLRKLRELGVGLCMDDFGRDQSSLSHLFELPLNVLKIDREFIRQSEADERFAAIIEATVTLGRRLGLVVVAEGVEEPEQARRLRALGCDCAQGYLVAPAMPSSQIPAWVRQWQTPNAEPLAIPAS